MVLVLVLQLSNAANKTNTKSKTRINTSTTCTNTTVDIAANTSISTTFVSDFKLKLSFVSHYFYLTKNGCNYFHPSPLRILITSNSTYHQYYYSLSLTMPVLPIRHTVHYQYNFWQIPLLILCMIKTMTILTSILNTQYYYLFNVAAYSHHYSRNRKHTRSKIPAAISQIKS